MILESMTQVQPARARVILITISTKVVTTLALESALRHTALPILIVDKGSTDGSWEHFSTYATTNPRVDLCRVGFEKHGATLDRIFAGSKDEVLVLLDSDFEIYEPELVPLMLASFEAPLVFGSGAIHGPDWLDHRHGFQERMGYYAPRMWTPLTALRVDRVQQALKAGVSFLNHWEPNEVVSIKWLSKALSFRFRIPKLKAIKLNFLKSFRGKINDATPNIICYDTGALIFKYLVEKCGYIFNDLGMLRMDEGGKHYHGVTRTKITKDNMDASKLDHVFLEVETRLREQYRIILD